MSLPRAVPAASVECDVDRVRHMLRRGRPADAVEAAERIAVESNDPGEVASALVMRLDGLLSQSRHAECAAAVDQAFAAVQAHPDPCTMAEFHALAASVAHLDGSLERCVTHLVHSARALGTVDKPSATAADAWFELAITFSHICFHGRALAAIEKAREIANSVGVPDHDYVAPQIRVRHAVSLDHRGDTDGCMRVLRDVVGELRVRSREAAGLAKLRPCARAFFGYAVTRLDALGEPTGIDATALLSVPGETTIRELGALAEVCTAISGGRPDDAIERLELLSVSAKTLAPAELPRLRALAHLAAGQPDGALAADRTAFRLTAVAMDRLRDLFVDGVAARLDHEDMRRTVARYADAALTDPLTGLPNRRHLEQYIDAVASRGERAMLGVLDLDGFKAVNTVHGHLSGDLVLQRVAGLIHRAMRRGDFLSRFGGDEFVVVLPATTLSEAYEVGRRVTAAVFAEDWHALVPGTPVSVSVGWSELNGNTGLALAFETADRAMLRAKLAARAS